MVVERAGSNELIVQTISNHLMINVVMVTSGALRPLLQFVVTPVCTVRKRVVLRVVHDWSEIACICTNTNDHETKVTSRKKDENSDRVYDMCNFVFSFPQSIS